MKKEFETLEFAKMLLDENQKSIEVCEANNQKCDWIKNRTKYYENIIQALTELKQIKEAKPSETLEELEKIIEEITISNADLRNTLKTSVLIASIKQALLKAQEQEKVLEIIRKKLIDTVYLRLCFKTSNGLEKYNNCHKVGYKLTEGEFDLLKRWSEK